MSVPDRPELRLNGSFSIEMWARLGSFANTWPGLLRKGPSWTANGYLIWYSSDGRVYFKRDNREFRTAPGVMVADRYRHLALTYDGASLRIYIDGALHRTFATSFPAGTSTQDLVIGQGDHPGRQFLDEVAIYDKALPASRVAAHYQVARGG